MSDYHPLIILHKFILKMVIRHIYKTSDIPVKGTDSCELLGFTGIVIQVIMLTISISSLFIKRFFEEPRRKWLIFFLDITKQGASLCMVHFVNLFFSVIYSKRTGSDQCAWYFTSILIDTTFGILVNWSLLLLVQSCLKGERSINLKSGNYFKYNNIEQKYEIDYSAWTKQTLIWCLIFAIMKTIVIIIQVNYATVMTDVSAYVLKPFVNKTLKLIFIIMVFPCFMNIFQFLIQDLILRKKKFVNGEDEILRDFFIVDEDYLEKMRNISKEVSEINDCGLKSMQVMNKEIEEEIKSDENIMDSKVKGGSMFNNLAKLEKEEMDKQGGLFGIKQDVDKVTNCDDDEIEV